MLDLKLLPVKQAAFLIKLIQNDGIGFAEGKSEGSVAKELYRKKLIEPFGMVDRRIRWKLVKHFDSKDRKYLDSLCEVGNTVQTTGART